MGKHKLFGVGFWKKARWQWNHDARVFSSLISGFSASRALMCQSESVCVCALGFTRKLVLRCRERHRQTSAELVELRSCCEFILLYKTVLFLDAGWLISIFTQWGNISCFVFLSYAECINCATVEMWTGFFNNVCTAVWCW